MTGAVLMHADLLGLDAIASEALRNGFWRMGVATERPTLDRQAQDLLFRTARTPVAFTSDLVTPAQLRAIWNLIRWAPTSANGQPLRMALIASTAAKCQLLEHVRRGNRATVASAPLVAAVAADLDFHRKLPLLYPTATGLMDAFESDPALRHDEAVVNTALQIGYLILGVRAAGLAAAPLAGFDVVSVSDAFFAGAAVRPLALIAIGQPKPGSEGPRLPRLRFDDVATIH